MTMDSLRADMAHLEKDRPPAPPDDAVGVTMFDQPGSEDGTLTVLLSQGKVQHAPAQALLRIESRADGRTYLGVVSAGPFALPDSLRPDSPVLVAVGTRGGDYLPPYHGRVQVTLLGERMEDGTLGPPRLRPLPHSPVYRLSAAESATVLKAEGDIRLGLAVGHQDLAVKVPSDKKAVLPRHTAILGTTGAGKSTTVANLIVQAQKAGMAVIVLDVEGEYTSLHEPTTDKAMANRLKELGLEAKGVAERQMAVYHLVDRETTNPRHPRLVEFSLQFSRLSPYAVMEILDLSDAQQERFLKAYDVAKEVLRELGIFPAKGNPEQERLALELDEFDTGYPRMTLPLLMDVVGACLARAEKGTGEKAKGKKGEAEEEDVIDPDRRLCKELSVPNGRTVLQKRVHAANPPGNVISWRAVLGRLARFNRLRVFYSEANGVRPIIYRNLLQPGTVSVIDLADSGFTELNNLVIADLLRGLQETQDDLYTAYERTPAGAQAKPPPRVLIVIEEAHEFLSEERIAKSPILFQQLARIAKRGRKRWLGLAFVTQLPGHLPRQVLGLCNGFILHKLTDPLVVASLRKAIGGLDEGLWARVPTLAPGQAVVSFPHVTRPLLTAMDPAPCKLRMAE